MMQIRLFSNNLISKDRTPPRCAVLFFERRKRTFNLPNLDGRAPWYDSTATIGGISNGGLPNITGVANIQNNIGSTGAFYAGSSTNTAAAYGQASKNTLNFDASRSSSVYDSGTTVRPAAVYTNWCIKF